MTETKWLTCVDPEPMLDFLGKANDRKLRLFAVACCRRIVSKLEEHRRRLVGGEGSVEVEQVRREARLIERAAKVGERWADGLMKVAELESLYRDAGHEDLGSAFALGPKARWTARTSAHHARQRASHHDREGMAQCNLLRCIFGNPFRSMALDPAWLAPKVEFLAKLIYEQRAFERMPVLAHALEQAGCNEEPILSHCLEPGEHTRGCWALDLVLGKG
jgi:hypothetical protein